mmetsp:Transcript_83363/g.165479  ORF Transcript_83363/g.165479 Transcript_83363/m.165479 type:complete len:876 (+) Transcript_83363:42-2669(+)|eukprot:CAMPEP_0172799932 /NCGR_PEP_ID=MMETSP1075-20121228/2210_1 /TAXON_ID=2916 /ORGANISM="Ceratium fusus, Strain PA161109" /LENGTH=875 /DNA_ID=CAMNT_0013637719 /DNA_START=41 /DNA_END=2668 /DNA_ORIENTATION=+
MAVAEAAKAVENIPLKQPEEVLRIGSRFGPDDDPHELGQELGSGAAARVYTCTQVSTREQRAVKVINLQKLHMGDWEGHLIKLNREVEILRQLHHPKIVNLHLVHETATWMFLVMELVRGGELFDEIVKNKSLHEDEAKHIFRQLLEAVHYMHSRHVIHRDLKPENILIASSRQAEPPMAGRLHEIKIADFGLSKIISDGTSKAKTFVGTPQYWAPEVLNVERSGGSYTHCVDFWSLGAVLFVMLCGRYPFDGKKKPLDEQIQTASFSMTSAAWQRVSDHAKDMVRGLLRVNPMERMNLESCLQHAWLQGTSIPAALDAKHLAQPATPSNPPLQSGPIVTEVSNSLPMQKRAPPIVTQPSCHSEASVDSMPSAENKAPGCSGSVGQQRASHEAARAPVMQMREVRVQDCATDQQQQETIFCLHELLKLQVSIAGSLEMACLAFRHADTDLSQDIRRTFWQARDIFAHASHVVSQYAEVAQQVGQLVLSDLQLAVDEREPSLAVSLLAMVKGWVANMKKDGEEIQRNYMTLQESVHKLVQRAQSAKTDADRRLSEAVQNAEAELGPRAMLSPRAQQQFLSLGPPDGNETLDVDLPQPLASSSVLGPDMETSNCMPPSRSCTSSGGNAAVASGLAAQPPAPVTTGTLSVPVSMNACTQKLFEHLSKVQAGSSSNSTEDMSMVGIGGGVDPEAWKKDVLELLFMAPGVTPAQLPKEEQGAVVRYMPAASGNSATEDDIAQTVTHSSASLLRALRELKRVDEILHGCSEFWANMDGTVQKLAQMKEHTETLVNFAAKSQALRKRFDERLKDYTNFWVNLERVCRQYCIDHQAASKRMYEEIREMADYADVVDTATSARNGVVLAMLERQRRHAANAVQF